MASSDDFNRWAARYGGVEEPIGDGLMGHLHSKVLEILGVLSSAFETKVAGSSIEAAVLSNDEFGGVATMPAPQQFFVGIFRGKISRLAETLSSVGPVHSNDHSSDPVVQVLARAFEADAEFGVLALLTAHHEFAHIAHGHIGWFSSLGVSKPEALRGGMATAFDFQVLEFDADAAAVQQITMIFLGAHWEKAAGRVSLPIGNKELFDGCLKRAKILGAAIYTHFWLSEVNSVTWAPSDQPTESSHPPLPVRFASALSLIGTLLTDPQWQLDPKLGELVVRAVIDGAVEREENLARANGISPNFRLATSPISKGVWAYQGWLSNGWRRMRPKLISFAASPSDLAPIQAEEWPSAPPFFIDP